MQADIEKRFVSVEKRLHTVEGSMRDYKSFKPTIALRLKTVEAKIGEYVRFKSTVFNMMEELAGALEHLSGMSLQFRSDFHHYKTAN